MRLQRIAVVTLLLVLPWSLSGQSRETLPDALTDQEFWSLTQKISEPDGYFRSNSGSPDNLLSNENTISTVAAQLATRLKPGGVYLGVGPEQNFTYIAAMKPRIAFITDIRRGNLHLHLVYKALFEMSANRAEFVSRLFTRKAQRGLTTQSSARELMDAYLDAQPGDARAFSANLTSILEHLTTTRRLPLTAADAEGIEYVLANFHRFGPAIHYTSSIGGGSRSSGTYAAIQSARDNASGAERTYLANEENFAFIKGLESKNLIVPIVGDFAGPKALRTLGAYLKQHGAIVTAFYVSNVEQYLHRNGVWDRFCANVASLPLDANSTFIRPDRGGFGELGTMKSETAGCGK